MAGSGLVAAVMESREVWRVPVYRDAYDAFKIVVGAWGRSGSSNELDEWSMVSTEWRTDLKTV